MSDNEKDQLANMFKSMASGYFEATRLKESGLSEEIADEYLALHYKLIFAIDVLHEDE